MTRGRFAPSPTGRMHLGNVFAALLSWLSPKSRGGGWILRMEDLDTLRTKEEYAQLLRDDLRWLGLDWDEETEPQSRRSAVYDRYFEMYFGRSYMYAPEIDGMIYFKGKGLALSQFVQVKITENVENNLIGEVVTS